MLASVSNEEYVSYQPLSTLAFEPQHLLGHFATITHLAHAVMRSGYHQLYFFL